MPFVEPLCEIMDVGSVGFSTISINLISKNSPYLKQSLRTQANYFHIGNKRNIQPHLLRDISNGIWRVPGCHGKYASRGQQSET
jgi:hypothetical protein